VLQSEVSISQVDRLKRQKLHQQVNVAFARAEIAPQHRTEGVQPCHVMPPAGGCNSIKLGLGQGEAHGTGAGGACIRLSVSPTFKPSALMEPPRLQGAAKEACRADQGGLRDRQSVLR